VNLTLECVLLFDEYLVITPLSLGFYQLLELLLVVLHLLQDLLLLLNCLKYPGFAQLCVFPRNFLQLLLLGFTLRALFFLERPLRAQLVELGLQILVFFLLFTQLGDLELFLVLDADGLLRLLLLFLGLLLQIVCDFEILLTFPLQNVVLLLDSLVVFFCDFVLGLSD